MSKTYFFTIENYVFGLNSVLSRIFETSWIPFELSFVRFSRPRILESSLEWAISMLGYVDVGDGCWRGNVLVTQ